MHTLSSGRTARPAAFLAVLLACVTARAATLVIHVQTVDGHALTGAVVTAHPLDGPHRHAAPLLAVWIR
jgi:hypothetical protein